MVIRGWLRQNLRAVLIAASVSVTVHSQSAPSVQQKATNSNCANIVAGGSVTCSSKATSRTADIYSGYLLPAHDPDKTTCRDNPDVPMRLQQQMGPLPEGVVAVFLGKNRYYATDFPYYPLMYEGNPVFAVERDAAGRVGITVDVRSKDGRIVARIKNGTFIVNRNNILTMKRPDKSTLIVEDQSGNEVLNVRYQNRSVIHFQGTLYLEGRVAPVVIKDGNMELGNLKMWGLCYSYNPLLGNMSSFVSKQP